MKYLVSILLIQISLSNLVVAQTEPLDLLQSTRWILNEKKYHGGEINFDTINFITESSSQVYSLPMHIRYSGFTFKPKVLVEHVWNKCGTGNPPNHRNFGWSHKKNSDNSMSISIESGNLSGEYLILSISSETLQLKRIN